LHVKGSSSLPGWPPASPRPFSGVSPPAEQTPQSVDFDLEEALSLLAALEDSRDVLIDTDHLAVLSQVEHQIQILSRKLGLDQGGPDVR
jgi:hypothetical protein